MCPDPMKWVGLISLMAYTGCSVTLPFNNRLNYESVSAAKNLRVDCGPVHISWNPPEFPSRVDVQGASGFVGAASQTHIPTGVALASRITEVLDQSIGLSPDAQKNLKIRVVVAESKFQYSAGFFNITPSIDRAECSLNAQFICGDFQWQSQFHSTGKDSKIGGSSTTGLLEAAWDDIAIQVGKDVIGHLSGTIPNSPFLPDPPPPENKSKQI